MLEFSTSVRGTPGRDGSRVTTDGLGMDRHITPPEDLLPFLPHYLGEDFTGRQGNYFAHVLLADRPAAHLAGAVAAATWGREVAVVSPGPDVLLRGFARRHVGRETRAGARRGEEPSGRHA